MDITTANRLYELRKQHGYSQDELADMLGVSRQAVSKWERSESSPDTDNLIALAKLYDVSLDELLGFKKEEQNEANSTETDVNDDKNETSSADCDNNIPHRDSVHIDENGIHLKDKNGEQVHITGGIAKFVNKIVGNIHIDDDDEEDEDDYDVKKIDIEHGHIDLDAKSNNHIKVRAIVDACATAISLITYLIIGFVCKLWHPGWLVFFFPFIVEGIAESIIKKNAYHFPIQIMATAGYLLMGFVWNLWHPGWIIFCVLPVYYMMVGFIKSIAKPNTAKNISIDIQTNEQSMDASDDENN